MNLDEEIINRDLSDLLTYFSKQTYSASGCDEQVILCFLSYIVIIVQILSYTYLKNTF